jgi:hypothetical protein
MPPPVVVDPTQLSRLASAARSTADTLADLAAAMATREPDGPAVYGDTGAGPAMLAFQTRWAAEANLASGGAQEFAEALRQSADAYHAADQAALRRLRIS